MMCVGFPCFLCLMCEQDCWLLTGCHHIDVGCTSSLAQSGVAEVKGLLFVFREKLQRMGKCPFYQFLSSFSVYLLRQCYYMHFLCQTSFCLVAKSL